MTYPVPVPVVLFRHATPMTPEEEDAYYEIHAEPVPRWISAPFILAVRFMADLLKAKAGGAGHVPRVPPARSCRPRIAPDDLISPEENG